MEDDLDQAHLLKFLLENEGSYTVTLAQDGLRGSGLVVEKDWDLVITDLNLPGADGMAVLETVRTYRPGTPVLATTGYEGPEYAQRAREQGASDVLLKPLDRDELLERVARLLAGGDTGAAARDGPEATVGGGTPVVEGTRDEGRPAPVPAPSPTEAPPPDPEPYPAGTSGPLRVLAVSIRPGDAEAGCGGSLLRHRLRGDQVVLLTLTHGSPGLPGAARRDQAKAAGRKMGIRFFVGNAGSGDDPLGDDLERLVRGALKEIRPDVVYIPTLHHADPAFGIVHHAAREAGGDVTAILAYDPGDAEPDFVPDHFVPVDDVLDEKSDALASFDAGEGVHLDPEQVATTARFWARHTGGRPAEALRKILGSPPSLEGRDQG